MNTHLTKPVMLIVVVAVVATLCVGFGKKEKPTDELIKIAAVGGGLVLDASARSSHDLLKIAAICNGGGGTLYLKNCGDVATIDLIKIAAAGTRHVVMEF